MTAQAPPHLRYRNMMRPSPYGGGMFGMFGRRRPPPFFGGGQFGGRRPFPGMYRGMPTFMNRRPPFGGGFRPPFGGNEGGFGGTDYSAQISELEKKIKELQAQLSGQPAASPAMPEPLPAMPKPPTASYNPVPQVDVDAFQQFKAGISPDRDEYLAGIRAENQLRQDKINSGELVPDPTQMDRGPRRYVTKAEAEMRMRQRAEGIAGISMPDFNTPPGTPMAIPPSVGGQYEEPAREFLKGTPAPLDPNYILQPGDPGYVTSGPAVPDFLRGGIGSIGGMMGGAGGRATPPSHLQATPHTPTGHIARLSPEVIAQAKARRMSRR